jgi:hypothetical protein
MDLSKIDNELDAKTLCVRAVVEDTARRSLEVRL